MFLGEERMGGSSLGLISSARAHFVDPKPPAPHLSCPQSRPELYPYTLSGCSVGETQVRNWHSSWRGQGHPEEPGDSWNLTAGVGTVVGVSDTLSQRQQRGQGAAGTRGNLP